MKTLKKISAIVMCLILAATLFACGKDKPEEKEETEPASATEQTSETEEETTEPAADTQTEETTQSQQTEVLGTWDFTDLIGYHHRVIKILPHINCKIEANAIATAADGSVIGKCSYPLVCCAEEENFIDLSFPADISNASVDLDFTSKPILDTGDPAAVKMVNYNVSGFSLYISLEQVAEKIGSFSKFKLLYFNGDELVRTEDNCYISILAPKLTGVGSTDVAELLAPTIPFDRIEFFYEP